MKKHDVKMGEEFHPSPQFKKLNYLYLIIILIFIITMFSPVFLASAMIYFSITAFLLIIFSLVAWWIPKYYNSMLYMLNDSEMTWRRGVWFKNTGVVPYNRITNIDIGQGPISRKFGVASLKIQTAGYSGSANKTSEIRIESIENFEEMREAIIGIVRGRKPVAVETYDTEDVNEKILSELIKIRKLLSK